MIYVKAFLVGIQEKGQAFNFCLNELKGLVKTLGMEVCGEMVITNVKPNPQYYKC